MNSAAVTGNAADKLKANMQAQGLTIEAGGQMIGARGTNIAAAGTRLAAGGTDITAAGTDITAAGTRLTAEGTRIGAEGQRITADETRLSAESLRAKAQGDIAEASNYDAAAILARQNELYTAASTRIQQYQNDRSVIQTIGGTRADVASAGMAESGSALDILRDSASQGALAHAILGQQGLITEAGYEE
jgi:hypothetical protein